MRLARARGISQLEEECARIRAAAAPDDEAERHRRARRDRGAWKHTNRDGSAEIRFRSSADDVAEAWSVIAAFAKRLVRSTGPNDGERPTFDQRNADGFMDLCRTAAAGTVLGSATEPTLPLGSLEPCRPAPKPKKVIVRVDLAALLRGYPTEGEACDIPGYGPVPVAAVRDMVASGNPVLAAVVTKGVDVATVAHLGREPTVHQQTAMEWLDPRCRAEGCDRTIGLERDHRIDWSPTQVTLLGWMEWLCTHHHDLKTTKGWRLVHGKGIRAFVPPDDARHPNHSPRHHLSAGSRGDSVTYWPRPSICSTSEHQGRSGVAWTARQPADRALSTLSTTSSTTTMRARSATATLPRAVYHRRRRTAPIDRARHGSQRWRP